MPKTDYKQGGDVAKDSTIKFKVSVLRCRKTGRVLFLEEGLRGHAPQLPAAACGHYPAHAV